MRRLIAAVFLTAVSAVSAFGSQQPSEAPIRVENVRTTQTSAGVIEVTYDLIATGRPRRVSFTLEASDDGGATWTVRPRTVTGDIGGVPPGPGKKIVWDAGKDIAIVPADIQVRVVPVVIEQVEAAPSRQTSTPSPSAAARRMLDVAFGYTFLQASNSFAFDRLNLAGGWFGGADVGLNGWLGIAAQITGTSGKPTLTLAPGFPYNSALRFVAVAVGPHFSKQANPNVTVFGEVLFGTSYVHDTGVFELFAKRNPAGTVVGGVDIGVSRCCGVRVKLAETFPNVDNDNPSNEFRFMTGLVYSLRKRP